MNKDVSDSNCTEGTVNKNWKKRRNYLLMNAALDKSFLNNSIAIEQLLKSKKKKTLQNQMNGTVSALLYNFWALAIFFFFLLRPFNVVQNIFIFFIIASPLNE